MADLLERMREDEVPEVGDVFQMFEGAYGTAIVTKVPRGQIGHGIRGDECEVERVMMSCTGATGTASTNYERMVISLEAIRKYKFYRRVTALDCCSHTINDNRWWRS